MSIRIIEYFFFNYDDSIKIFNIVDYNGIEEFMDVVEEYYCFKDKDIIKIFMVVFLKVFIIKRYEYGDQEFMVVFQKNFIIKYCEYGDQGFRFFNRKYYNFFFKIFYAVY